MFGTTQRMGLDLGIPDVCNVPPGLPLPFPNVALPEMGVGAAYQILNGGMPAHTVLTTIPLTQGDDPGVMGGMISQTDMGPSRRLTGAFTVLLDGMPATRLTSFGLQNLINCPGTTIVPSQLTVLYLAP
jgi:hypothetical protein